mgnify:CR=1 FL=1
MQIISARLCERRARRGRIAPGADGAKMYGVWWRLRQVMRPWNPPAIGSGNKFKQKMEAMQKMAQNWSRRKKSGVARLDMGSGGRQSACKGCK